LPEIPPGLPFSKEGELPGTQSRIPSTFFPSEKGSGEKIEWKKSKASLVGRGRGEFLPPKPGGHCLTVKHFPDFRGATPATFESIYKEQNKKIIFSRRGRKERREEKIYRVKSKT
jgi:hypothetical protein